jgi:hypothetical protein
MDQQTFNPRTIAVFIFILAAAVLRVVFNLQPALAVFANFTPVGAMALFSGAYFNKPSKAFLFPLITLWLSDIVLSRLTFQHEWRLFYHGCYFTYGSFALMVLAGKYLLRNVSVKSVMLSALAITAIHWIVTDFGVWLDGSMYQKTLSGWWTCLAAAIPFERNFLCGTLLYSLVMFGSFEWMKSKYPQFKIA